MLEINHSSSVIDFLIETFIIHQNRYILIMSDTPQPYRRTLLLDGDGDLQFDGAGKLVMTSTDDEKRAQDILIYLKTIFGNDIFNPGYGFNIISAKEQPVNPAKVEYEIRKTLHQYMSRSDRPNRIKAINSIIVSEPNTDRAVQVDVNLTADTNSISALQVSV